VTYAGLRRCTRAWQRCLDDAGVPPGARVGVRLADPGIEDVLLAQPGVRPAAFHLVAKLPVGPTGKVARRRLQDLAATRVTPSAA
jgi:hypothetical protein